MADDGFWALQKALYQRLSTDAGVVAALGGPKVFDDVPRAATFPYVTFGAARSDDWSTGDSEGREHIAVVNVWSRAGGRREALTVAEAIRAALAAGDLTLNGHRVVLMRLEAVETRRGADGETYQASLRLKVLSEATA